MIKKIKNLINDVVHAITELKTALADPDDTESLQSALVQLAVSVAKIVVPIMLLIVGIPWAIAAIKPYIPYIIGTAVLYFIFAPKPTEPENPEDEAKQHYQRVRDFLYQPLCDLAPYLPIKRPQVVEDIEHEPKVDKAGNGYVMVYKLAKTRSDTTDGDALAFATKILRANITQRLNHEEALYGDGATYIDDVCTVTAMDIRDRGTHYLIRVIYTYNKASYELAKSCHRAERTPLCAPSINRKDDDF